MSGNGKVLLTTQIRNNNYNLCSTKLSIRIHNLIKLCWIEVIEINYENPELKCEKEVPEKEGGVSRSPRKGSKG